MELLGDRTPPRLVIAAIALGVVFFTWMTYAWWQRRALGAGGEDACRDHLARYHEDCARLAARGGAGRISSGPKPWIDQEAYLECVVLGADEWVRENGRRGAQQERQRAGRYP